MLAPPKREMGSVIRSFRMEGRSLKGGVASGPYGRRNSSGTAASCTCLYGCHLRPVNGYPHADRARFHDLRDGEDPGEGALTRPWPAEQRRFIQSQYDQVSTFLVN
jgi:hypothetical protein